MKLIISLVVFLFSNTISAAEPISAEALLSKNDNVSSALSPSGKLVLTIDMVENYQVISLIDPATQSSSTLLEIGNSKELKIKNYLWLDESHLYIQLGYRHGILKITRGDKSTTAKWHYVQSSGYVVSGLPDQENRLLFARESSTQKPKTRLYFLSPKQLIDADFENAIRYPVELRKAKTYVYDEEWKTLLSLRLSGEDVDFFYLNKQKNKWQKFLTLSEEIKFMPVGFVDENTLAVLTNDQHDLVSLVEFDIRSKSYGKILFQHPMYDLTGAEVSISRGLESVSYVDHGMPKVEYFDNSMKLISQKLQKTFEGTQPLIIDRSLDGEHLLIGVFDSNTPGEVYYFSNQSQIATKLFDIKDFDKSITFARALHYTVETNDGEKIESFLTLPQSNGNGVLLVYPHGGPIGVRDYSTFNREAQYLTSRGFAVLNVNFRGSAGFGKAFLEKGKAEFGSLIEQDISAAVEHVKKLHQFDRQCSIGSSYGGYSAMMLAITHPEEYDCVVSMYGVYDLLHLFNASNYRTLEENQKSIAEVVGEKHEKLKAASPFFLAEKLTVPTLLIAGTEDSVADFEQANRMKYRLKQLNKSFEHLFYQGVGHGHKKWWGSRHQLAFVDDFLRRTLDLKRITNKSIDSAFGEDLAIIADAYEFGSSVENSPEKAAEYYKLAAEYGHARSMFNLGSYYHQGKYFGENIELALEWYEKAMEAGYSNAALRLGRMYWEGLYIPQDFEQSYKYFVKAKELENELANIYISRAQCLGKYAELDFESCVNILFLKNKTNRELKKLSDRYKKTIRLVLAEILWAEKPQLFDIKKFVSEIEVAYELDTTKVKLDDVDSGLVDAKFFKHRVTDENVKIPLERNIKFGAILEVEAINDKGLDRDSRTMVKVRWTVPEQIEELNETFTYTFKLGQEADFVWRLALEKEMIAGDWKLEVETLDGTPLFSETYTTSEDN